MTWSIPTICYRSSPLEYVALAKTHLEKFAW